MYLAVMGTALIVAVISLAAMHVARLELRSVSGIQDRLRAQSAARSAVELALTYLASHPHWRQELESGEPMPAENWGELNHAGQYRWQLSEDDGDFTDDDSETVRLRAMGRSGDAVYVESLLLEPRGAPLDCVAVSVYSRDDAWIQNYPLSSNQTVACGGSMQVVVPTYVIGDIETSGSYAGYYVSGYTLAQNAAPRRLPGASAFDYYLAAGSPIAVDALPLSAGYRVLEKCALGPGANPYGSPNPRGIYVLDCGGANLRIRNLRIVGTLVLTNPGPNTEVVGDVHWEPAARHLPALLVDGSLRFTINGYGSSTQLREWLHNVNFNPPGAPYEGQTDGDKADQYPNSITGLVYVSGTLTAQLGSTSWNRINGCLLTGKLLQYDGVEVSYDPVFRYHPPPGFAHGSQLRPIPGSWRREAL